MSMRAPTVIVFAALAAFGVTTVHAQAAEKARKDEKTRRHSQKLMVKPGKTGAVSMDGGKQTSTIKIPTPPPVTEKTAVKDDTSASTDEGTPAKKPAKDQSTRKGKADQADAADPVGQLQGELAAPPFQQGAFSNAAPPKPAAKSTTKSSRTKKTRGSAPRQARTPHMRMR